MEQPKELTINGQLYAKYEFKNSEILFLQVIKKDLFKVKNKDGFSGAIAEVLTENLIIELIQAIEGRKFNACGYLKIRR